MYYHISPPLSSFSNSTGLLRDHKGLFHLYTLSYYSFPYPTVLEAGPLSPWVCFCVLRACPTVVKASSPLTKSFQRAVPPAISASHR